MKKVIAIMTVAVVICAAAFGQEETQKKQGIFSVGVGEYFISDFGGGIEGLIKTPYVGGGGFVFFDARYAELSLGIFGAGGRLDEPNMALMGLDSGLLVKYPFAPSDKLALYPLLGINYRLMLSAKDEDGNQHKNSSGDDAPGDFSALWFKVGLGLDYFVTDNIYIRFVESYGIRLANTFENDAPTGGDALLGHGCEIKFSVGYRF
jgi:opacity protein-like surface antigen